ncbi:MBP isoform 22 [Pongo abelii]|uniref:Myelin basic protein n=1 Tax=Pongo abelii TaxID=9601 RepID=A0A2J8T7N7_PONAB|nr:MBP isoform 22 [Pongo abelii]
MASQKRPSQRHGSKYLATASTMDHARHGFLPRARFPKFLSWGEEIVALDHPWLDAENSTGSGILSSAS